MTFTVEYDHVIGDATYVSHSFEEMASKHFDWLCDEGILYKGFEEEPFTKEQFKAVIKFLSTKSENI